mgnify:FL=1
MKLSNRIRTINKGGSDGWEVFLKARQMIADGHEVVELTIGEHDRRTDATIIHAMYQSAVDGNTGYASIPGILPLRQAIATRVQTRTGVATGPENIVVTPGGQAALFASHMAVCDPGDKALYLNPYYATYPGTLRASGCVDVAVPTRSANAFQPTRAELEALYNTIGKKPVL